MSENETTTAEETAVTTLARFEVPSRLEKIEDPNDANHLTFVAEPFENGYGHTLGNSLRRVLLGSLEGAAITSVRIAGAQHEFSSLPGVVEDVTEIVLNLKKVKFKHNGKDVSLTLSIPAGVVYGEKLHYPQVRAYDGTPLDITAEIKVRTTNAFTTIMKILIFFAVFPMLNVIMNLLLYGPTDYVATVFFVFLEFFVPCALLAVSGSMDKKKYGPKTPEEKRRCETPREMPPQR